MNLLIAIMATSFIAIYLIMAITFWGDRFMGGPEITREEDLKLIDYKPLQTLIKNLGARDDLDRHIHRRK